MTDLPIYCGDCGATGTVKMAQLAAPLQCKCGSINLGLDGVDNQKTAAHELFAEGRVHGLDGLPAAKNDPAYLSGHADGSRELQARFSSFAASREPWMQQVAIRATAAGGTGWTGPDPRRTEGWSEYAGPTPQVVHRNPPVAEQNQDLCPACNGTGYDVIDKTVCRECGGTGKAPMHPTGGPNPQYGETRDPGRALPAGGAHWASLQRVAWNLSSLNDGEEAEAAGHKITYYSEQAMGDDNKPARGYTVGEYVVEHPGHQTQIFRHSPYKPNSWAGEAKRYAADQAIRDAHSCTRCRSREGSRKEAGQFNDGHTERYLAWANSEGRNPDHVNTLKAYEKQPGIGRAHTDYLADQLYVGGGDSDWRQNMHRDAAKAKPGSPEDVIRHSTPGYGERGMRPPPEGQFDPENMASYYPKAQSISPNVKAWEPAKPTSGPYRMDAASCPSCGTRPTELVKDKNEDAWWHCPNCGPLKNIDKHPEVDPYNPPENFEPDRSMKTGGFMSRNRKTGRLMSMLAVLHEHNELGEAEAVSLARASLRQYGEDR